LLFCGYQGGVYGDLLVGWGDGLELEPRSHQWWADRAVESVPIVEVLPVLGLVEYQLIVELVRFRREIELTHRRLLDLSRSCCRDAENVAA
jgi:hypothetical protein